MDPIDVSWTCQLKAAEIRLEKIEVIRAARDLTEDEYQEYSDAHIGVIYWRRRLGYPIATIAKQAA
jgi:hypothetical protein